MTSLAEVDATRPEHSIPCLTPDYVAVTGTVVRSDGEE